MVTFCLHEEDHTLGNVLRWMCMKESVSHILTHPPLPRSSSQGRRTDFITVWYDVATTSSSAGTAHLTLQNPRSTCGFRCTVSPPTFLSCSPLAFRLIPPWPNVPVEGKSAVTCLMTALANLKDLYKTIDTKYAADLT